MNKYMAVWFVLGLVWAWGLIAIVGVLIGYKKDVSDDVSFKLQTDVGRLDSGVSDDRWAVYLKKAHLDWKVSQDTKISMGMIGLNMLNVQEKTWGNRFISKSALDYYGYSATADLGFAIYLSLIHI